MRRISSHILQYQLVFSATAYLHVAAVSNLVYLSTLYLTSDCGCDEWDNASLIDSRVDGILSFSHNMCSANYSLCNIWSSSWQLNMNRGTCLAVGSKKGNKKGKKFDFMIFSSQTDSSTFLLVFHPFFKSNNTVKNLYTSSLDNVHMIMNFINFNAVS